MSIAIVLGLLVLAVVVFATEWIEMEAFSLMVIGTLVVTRVLDPQEAFLGFASPAVVMIAGVMILTGALLHNGALDMVGAKLLRSARAIGPNSVVAGLLAAVNIVSTIVNNVAATALFIPMAETAARRLSVPRAIFLMPVAFASMTGGMCTLIGTSTNVAVAGALSQYGLAPMGMFELAPVGIAVALVGVVYMFIAAPLLLRVPDEPAPVEAYGLREFLYELTIDPAGPFAGKTIAEVDLERRHGLLVLAVQRGSKRIEAPGGGHTLQADDTLIVESSVERIVALRGRPGLTIKAKASDGTATIGSGEATFVEATVTQTSPLIGKTLQQASFRQTTGLTVVGIHRREARLVDKVGKIPIRTGDVLLIYGGEQGVKQLAREQPSLIVAESAMLSRYDLRRTLIAALVFFTAVGLATVGWLDAPTAFLAGGAVAIALRCVPADRLGEYVNVRFLVMIAAMTSLGTAMEQTGAANLVADNVIALIGNSSPQRLLAAVFLLTVLLTQPLSNAAAALLVLPIAISGANALGVDPRPFAMAVTLGASCSFLSPFEPACLLVYSRGSYRFLDFVRFGAPLTAIAFLVCMVLIPRIWPFVH